MNNMPESTHKNLAYPQTYQTGQPSQPSSEMRGTMRTGPADLATPPPFNISHHQYSQVKYISLISIIYVRCRIL